MRRPSPPARTTPSGAVIRRPCAAPARSRRTARRDRPRRRGRRVSARCVNADALRRVAGRAVEQRADQLGVGQAHLLDDLVDEQLHHVQLVGGQPRDAPREREARGRRARRRGPPRWPAPTPRPCGRRAASPVSSSRLERSRPEPVGPHRGGRRAPDPGRRVADPAVLGADDQVRAEREVGAAADAEAVDLGDRPASASATAPCRCPGRSGSSSAGRPSGPTAGRPRPRPSTPTPSRCRSRRRTPVRRRAAG